MLFAPLIESTWNASGLFCTKMTGVNYNFHFLFLSGIGGEIEVSEWKWIGVFYAEKYTSFVSFV